MFLWIIIIIGLLTLVYFRAFPLNKGQIISKGNQRQLETSRFWVRTLITFVVLAFAMYIIKDSGSHLNEEDLHEQQKWAFGVVGTILGYWLNE